MTRADTRPETTALHAFCRFGEEALNRMVVVGGGAAGLELVTRLGDHLGRRSRASVSLVECARTISGSRCYTLWRRAASIPANAR
jgi:NADH:ubiquinone reductase (H+-translocating)